MTLEIKDIKHQEGFGGDKLRETLNDPPWNRGKVELTYFITLPLAAIERKSYSFSLAGRILRI